MRVGVRGLVLVGVVVAGVAIGAPEGSAQPYAFVSTHDGVVSVIDTATMTWVTDIPVPGGANGFLTATPDGTRVYVADYPSGTVSAIDTRTRAVVARVDLGSVGVYGVAASPDGSRVYVVNYRGVNDYRSNMSVLSATTHTEVLPRIDLLAGGSRHIALTPDGTKAWVTNQWPSSLSVVDLASHQVQVVYTYDNFAHGVAVSPDGRYAYSANLNGCDVAIVDTATHGLAGRVRTGCRPRSITFSPDGARAYVVFDGNGGWTTSGVTEIDTASRIALRTVETGYQYASLWGALTPDGAWLYVTDSSQDEVSVIDTATLTVHAGIPVAWGPVAVVIPPVPTIEARIDVKPGAVPNCMNINGHGVIPVAVLGGPDLNVGDVDTTSLLFAGLKVRVRGNHGPQCGVADTDLDGFDDLVCQFEDDPASWTVGEGTATLRGTLWDGTPFEGTDSICVVP